MSTPPISSKRSAHSADELGQFIRQRFGPLNALARAFTPPLAFDPNQLIHLSGDSQGNAPEQSDLLSLLLAYKPNHYLTYAHRLLDAGFSCEGRNQYELGRLLLPTLNSDPSLIEKAMAKGLDLHAIKSEAEPYNLLCQAIQSQDHAAFEWLMRHGLDPYVQVSQTRGQGLVSQSLFAESMKAWRARGEPGLEENDIGIPLTLFRKGVAQVVSIAKDNPLIGFKDCHGYSFFTAYFPGSFPWEIKRYNAFTQAIHEMQELADSYISGQKQMEEMTPDALLQCYAVGKLEAIYQAPGWQGHEAHLYALYEQMPEHIRAAMEPATTLLVVGAARQAQSQIQGPAQHWNIESVQGVKR